jgi:mannose-6-phosphate isomerase-like protein (cupin superfamily)
MRIIRSALYHHGNSLSSGKSVRKGNSLRRLFRLAGADIFQCSDTSSNNREARNMNQFGKILVLALVLIAAVFTDRGNSLADDQSAPQIKSVPLDPGDKSYFLLLKGPPETRSFRSGLVTLAPRKSIGVHNSGVNEEMLVPLEGQGELRFSNHPPLLIKSGLITYAPAHTEHDVINTGSSTLRYIFITAKAE